MGAQIAAALSPSTDSTPAAVSKKTSAAIVQAIIRDGQTSLQLSRGEMYLYGMAIGGAGSSTSFAAGPYAQVFHEKGLLAAAVAYGTNSQNAFTTATGRHVVGGVSVGGSWDTFRAFYGSNGSSGASSAAANFTVSQNSLVVILGLAASQQDIKLQGIPGLQIDASNSGPSASAAMIVAHTYLEPGTYTLVERSTGLAGGQNSDYMADLIGIFVFGSNH